jgi:hypothetical protein
MVVLALGAALAGVWLALDPREVPSGDPVALKPLKFFLSFTIHVATLAWIGGLLRRAAANDRWFAAVVHVQIVCIVVELAAIVVQATRGVESHFNYATAFDRAMFTAMGLGVAVMSLSFVALLVGLARRPGGSPLALLAVRLGVVGLLAGFIVGGAMVLPTDEQAAAIEEGVRPVVIGAHGPTLQDDADPGVVPLFGWSYAESDWRTAHFVGVHALQMLPLFSFLVFALPSRLILGARTTIFLVLSGLYTAVFLYAAIRTLDGRSALAIDSSVVGSAGLALLCAAVLAAIASFIWRRAAVHPLSG